MIRGIVNIICACGLWGECWEEGEMGKGGGERVGAGESGRAGEWGSGRMGGVDCLEDWNGSGWVGAGEKGA